MSQTVFAGSKVSDIIAKFASVPNRWYNPFNAFISAIQGGQSANQKLMNVTLPANDLLVYLRLPTEREKGGNGLPRKSAFFFSITAANESAVIVVAGGACCWPRAKKAANNKETINAVFIFF